MATTLTATDWLNQIITQTRLLDPSVSFLNGTPEWKIASGVAQNLANAQVSMTGLTNALNISSKVGSNLDQFTANFGVNRQQSTAATGYVIFSRPTAAPANIVIPQGVCIQASNVNVNVPTTVQFTTTTAGTIAQGQTTSDPVPVQAVTTGSATNIAAGVLNSFVGTIPAGISAVTNPVAITNALDAESDAVFTARFQNTWGRNLSGTTSAYLATALAGAFSTKAVCIGQQSTFIEYIQVPNADDSGVTSTETTTVASGSNNVDVSTFTGSGTLHVADATSFTDTGTIVVTTSAGVAYINYTATTSTTFTGCTTTTQGVTSGDLSTGATVSSYVYYTINGINAATTTITNGTGLWTTATSDIPYAKNIFTTIPTFISENGSGTYYYQQGIDYLFNATPLIQGDALREVITTAVGTPTDLSTPPFDMEVDSTVGFTTTGTLYLLASDSNWYTVTYTGITTVTATDTSAFTGCDAGLVSGSPTTVAGNPIYQIPTDNTPNFTFTNISSIIDQATGQYSTLFDATTGTWVTNSATVNPDDTLITVQALTPGQVVQSEYSYVSSASRNDISANINNCIDVYVNGLNPQQTSCVFMPPSNSTTSLNAQFTNNPSSAFYIENFRRDGEPQQRPNVLNYWTPLFNSPILSLPSTITGPDGSTFFLGIHYWLVHEVSPLVNSIRARDGIEWSYELWGDNQITAPFPNAGYLPAGPTTSTIMNYGVSRLPVEVDNYTNDANIINMQATYDTTSPATTDVLAHGAKIRYFKFDITLMYSASANPAAVQASIASTLQAYLNNQYFGTVIQLSSILEQISSVSGVQNVRWTNDLPVPPNYIRAIETDILGNPLAGVSTNYYAPYTASNNASFTLTVTGANFGDDDTFILTWNDTDLGLTFSTAPILYTATTAEIATAINTVMTTQVAPYSSGVTINSTPLYQSSDSNNPYIQYLITYAADYSDDIEQPFVPTVLNNLSQGTYLYNEDFFLKDDELPTLPTGQVAGDTLPGLIARTRAENTFFRPGTN